MFFPEIVSMHFQLTGRCNLKCIFCGQQNGMFSARDREEEDLFRRLVARNAKNMAFQSYEIRFTGEEQVETAVRQEVEAWKRS